MIREHILNLHRRLFGRCQGCGKRLKSYRPRILGYQFTGWLRSEAGMWHAGCLGRRLQSADGKTVYTNVSSMPYVWTRT